MKTEFIWVKNIADYPQYYVHMFGVKDISKALGLCIHTTDCHEWLLAVQNNCLLAFSGYDKTNSAFVLKRAYVFQQYRGLGIYKKMIDLRLERASELGYKIVQTTTTQMSKMEFEKRGFFTTKNYKKYQTWRKFI